MIRISWFDQQVPTTKSRTFYFVAGSSLTNVNCIYLRILVSNTISISYNVRVVLRHVSLVEQEMLTISEHTITNSILSGVRFAQSFVFSVVFWRTLFVILSFFLVAIVLSVLWPLYYLSCGHCIISLSSYGFWFPHSGIFKCFLKTLIFSLVYANQYDDTLGTNSQQRYRTRDKNTNLDV